MTTATLHANVQRSRFAHLALEALTRWLPAAWRVAPPPARRVTAHNRVESAAREAQQVRSLAHSYSRTDPGFAADLYAAAARHEGLYTD